ncbi:hypothetical protein K439DRAFT_1638682, partial [Ramaria rubella]
MGDIGLQGLFIFVAFLAMSFHKKVKKVYTGRTTRWKPLLCMLQASLDLYC